MKILFWILSFAFFYTYLGYAALIALLTLFRKKNQPGTIVPKEEELPEVCLLIASYNEKNILSEKIENCFHLDYPCEKLKITFITDGSDDGSPEFLRTIDGITVFHDSSRRGKINALNRGMQFVTSPVVVFTDANTFLNPEAIRVMAGAFSDPRVGCVAGRKQVINTGAHSAAETGEGLYWHFESWLKKKDAEYHSAVGAVGELFAIRTELFEPVDDDIVLDDLIISFRIVEKGYYLRYTPDAIASEKASFNVEEELKRKKRIAAGGIQTLFRMPGLLNPFRYGKLTFQYLSHKVSRWTFAPWCFFLLLPVNIIIVLTCPEEAFYQLTLLIQLLFYGMSALGWITEKKKIRSKLFFLPYYFTAINMATIAGQFRYMKGKQPAAWERAKRI